MRPRYVSVRGRLDAAIYTQLADHFGRTNATELAATNLTDWLLAPGPGRDLLHVALASSTPGDPPAQDTALTPTIIRQLMTDVATLAYSLRRRTAEGPDMADLAELADLDEIARRWAT